MINQADDRIAPHKPAALNASYWHGLKMALWVVILLSIAGAALFGYRLMTQENRQLKHHVLALQATLSQVSQRTEGMQRTMQGLQNVAERAETVASRQEQLLASWQVSQQGDMNRWHVAEAEYLVKLAEDHVNLLKDTSLAKAMLLRADEILGSISDPALLPVRQSLANDITVIQAIPAVNISGLYVQLNLLNARLDQLVLPNNPVSSGNNLLITKDKATPLTWWEAFVDKLNKALSKMVVVHYNSGQAPPLVMPEAKAYLYQNLHAQMENVMWAVLHRNNEVYQASLTRMINWIQTYFVQEDAKTTSMLHDLRELKSIPLQADTTVNFAATLQLFATYLRKS